MTAADLFELTGRVALVTGGNGGLGLGLAKGLARAGAHVVLAGRNGEKTARAVDEIAAQGGRAEGVSIDVADPGSIKAVVDAVVARHGRLDVLVNNAGLNVRKLPEEQTLEEWRLILDTNLTSVFVGAQAAYPHMKRLGGGKIINVGSMMSLFGASFLPAYAASKGGVIPLTKSLACAWAKDNIQVNAILPGWIDTDLTRQGRRDVPDLEARVVARTPAGRYGTPDELQGTAIFLASHASDFITGAAIPVDGGYSSQG